MIRIVYVMLLISATLGCTPSKQDVARDNEQWRQAVHQGHLVNESFERCRKFVDGWLAYADPHTGLIPRNLDRDTTIWNAKDAAADNYPFMVLTAALTDSALFRGRMLEMLNIEKSLTSRVGHLPDTYQFDKGGFQHPEVDMDRIIFGASEYVKDGLLPLTEWLGPSPWSTRMLDIVDDIWKHAQVETSFGLIPSENVEVNGEMLQVLSRLYWMTSNEEYLSWALRLGDYYLLGNNHPSRDMSSLRLRDHGCEIISGLCELYATLHFSNQEKKKQYEKSLHQLLNRALEVGRHPDGLFYDVVNPQTGAVINDRIADNFGYNFNGFYILFQLDSIKAYQEATRKALRILPEKYRNYNWENESADGYADAIEGALNLFNREPIAEVADWIDSEIKVMWSKQQADGTIEGWHGDGNFARTTIMYALWKSNGVTASPWRSDLAIGATSDGDTIWVSIDAASPWNGTIKFDRPRHKNIFQLPYDWPRINQFPEWFTVLGESQYTGYHSDLENELHYSGAELASGLPIRVGDTPVKIKLWFAKPSL